ncbi:MULTISPECIES: GtrA family protein [unclassified Shewanella]|uniref:GtrA family protein n=1 Tax=unclassified Shewanella TaxID=196818 RepID=UPI001C7DAD46|nr:MULTISPECIES: GtrA family protein [unclassified Shewanella]
MSSRLATLSVPSLESIWLKHGQGIRFLLVGGAVFVFDAALFYGLLNGFELPLMLARCCAFVCAVIVSWLANRCWTFGERKQAPKSKQLLMSVVVSSLGASVNLMVFYLCSTMLSNSPFNTLLSFSLGILAGLFINWFGANRWTFKAAAVE